MYHSFNLHTVGSNLANCLSKIALGWCCELIVLATSYNWGASVVGGRVISDGLLAWRISSGRSGIAGVIVRGWDFGFATMGLLRREGEIGSRAKPDTAITLDSSKN